MRTFIATVATLAALMAGATAAFARPPAPDRLTPAAAGPGLVVAAHAGGGSTTTSDGADALSVIAIGAGARAAGAGLGFAGSRLVRRPGAVRPS
jgi:hypothetical protein